MKKFFLPALVALLLVGCNKTNDVVNPDTVFKEDISKVLALESTSHKSLIDDINNEMIVDIVDDIMKNEYLGNLYASYGTESQGIGSDSNGNKVFCYKFPVEFDLDGGEKEVKEFAHELEEVPVKISVSRFDVTNKEDKFHVNAIVNFLGDMDSTSISSNSSPVNFKKNTVEINEKKEVSLRDFDVNLTIRPSNSDSSAIALGVKNSNKCLYSDDNGRHDIIVNFSKKNGKFYAEYSVNEESSVIESFSSNGDIKFDVLSCDKVLEDDYISVDLIINNTSDKKVSVVIYDDDDKRVNVVSKSGNVTVDNE